MWALLKTDFSINSNKTLWPVDLRIFAEQYNECIKNNTAYTVIIRNFLERKLALMVDDSFDYESFREYEHDVISGKRSRKVDEAMLGGIHDVDVFEETQNTGKFKGIDLHELRNFVDLLKVEDDFQSSKKEMFAVVDSEIESSQHMRPFLLKCHNEAFLQNVDEFLSNAVGLKIETLNEYNREMTERLLSIYA